MNFLKPPLKFLINLSHFLFHYSDYKKLITENKNLTEEITKLKLENSQLNYLRNENERLRNLLNFKKQIPYSTIAGEVIGFQYSENRKIIFISRGEKDGVFKNMVCLNQAGLIGKVIETSENTSTVMCINDPNSRVPAKTVDTEDFGLVYGTTKGELLQMKFLPKDTQTKIGSLVVTSGLGSIYPKGIVIGEICAIRDEEFYKTAFIKPAFNFSSLEVVLLVK